MRYRNIYRKKNTENYVTRCVRSKPNLNKKIAL